MNHRRALVTGGAGFIGSHLVDRLVELGWEVSVLDNLSTGKRKWIERHLGEGSVRFFAGDLADRELLDEALTGCEYVFHLAADPVIRGGFDDEGRRFSPVKNNILGTYSLLEGMARSGGRGIAFASSSVVYGQADVIPTPESFGPLRPISLYGASKLAGEGLVTAYAHGMGWRYWIFRFANVVGIRMGQGVVYDFVTKLKRDARRLRILGDGRQRKCYLDVADCVNGMIHAVRHSRDEIFNLGTPTPISVDRVAAIVEEVFGLEGVEHMYTGGSAGWKGDLPVTYLSIEKMMKMGWRPEKDSEEAVRCAAANLLKSSA